MDLTCWIGRMVVLGLSLQALQAQPQLGIVASAADDSVLYHTGYKFRVESVPYLLSPASDSSFRQICTQLRQLRVPVYALNIFIPGELKLVGPDVNQRAVLDYTRKVFERSQQAGIGLIVWGSGGARRIPDGFSVVTARQQFIDLAGKVADQAAHFKITLALENLNATETNFITTVTEALEIVKAVDRPNFRLCADLYHMLKQGEPASVLLQTKGYLVHADIAEKENRTPPGTQGDDFRSYFRALRQIDYRGKLVLECRWRSLPAEVAGARTYLQQQINDVWN